MRIVRVGNQLKPIQRRALQQHYGQDVEIITLPSSISSTQQIKTHCKRLQADVLEIVIDGSPDFLGFYYYSGRYDAQSALPLRTLVELLDPVSGVGIPIITAQGLGTVEADGSERFHFRSYSRITGIQVQSEPLPDE